MSAALRRIGERHVAEVEPMVRSYFGQRDRRSGGRVTTAPVCPTTWNRSLQVIEKTGAGEGNRTLVISLEGCCSTIELHPRTKSHSRWRPPPSPRLRRRSRAGLPAEAPKPRRLVGEVGLEPTKA